MQPLLFQPRVRRSKESHHTLGVKVNHAVRHPANMADQLSDAIENYEKVAAKATAAGNAKKATEALESAAARRVWLAEAEKGLAEFN